MNLVKSTKQILVLAFTIVAILLGAFAYSYFSTETEVASAAAGEYFLNTVGGKDTDYFTKTLQTKDGGYIVAGKTESDGEGQYDALLIKFDSDGNEEWTKLVGGIGSDSFSDVKQTADDGYVAAGSLATVTSGVDGLLVKFDSAGNEQWITTIGDISPSKGDYFSGVEQTTLDGGYIVVGSTANYGAGSSDGWILKFDSAGNLLWSKTVGQGSPDYLYDIQQTTDGGYIAAGTFYKGASYYGLLVKFDGSGNEQWTKTVGGGVHDRFYTVQQTTDGGYVASGFTTSFGAGGVDGLLMKFDSDGNEEWTKVVGGTADDPFSSVQQTTDGGYIVSGGVHKYDPGSNGLLIKFDGSGNEQWAKTVGGSGLVDSISHVQQIPDGYIAAGTTNSYGAGQSDGQLIKFDNSGNITGCGNVADVSLVYTPVVVTETSESISAISQTPSTTSPALVVSSTNLSEGQQCDFVGPPPQPDLITDNLDGSGTFEDGQTITFDSDVFNVGTGDTAVTVTSRFCLDLYSNDPSGRTNCMDDTMSISDLVIGEPTTGPLTAGGPLENESTTWNATPGSHTLYFCTDVDKDVTESDEGLGSMPATLGNCTEVPVNIPSTGGGGGGGGPAPDLVVLTLSDPGFPSIGQNITFDAEIQNNGDRGTGASMVSVGMENNCALLSTGNVECWGFDGYEPYNEIQDGYSGRDATSVAISYLHACALLENGNVWCWGENSAGPSGEAEPYMYGDAKEIMVGDQFSCALLESGDVDCWGRGDIPGTTVPGLDYAGGNAIKFAKPYMDDWHVCMLVPGGNVECIMKNSSGQAEPYLLGDAEDVVIGPSATCAILSGGDVKCWGSGWTGTEVAYSGGDAIDFSEGRYNQCALLTGGNVDCWGDNFYGEALPGVDYTGGGMTDIHAGNRFWCGLVNGDVNCWGSNDDNESVGYVGGDAIDLEGSYKHSCALLESGEVDCWGDNWANQSENLVPTFSSRLCIDLGGEQDENTARTNCMSGVGDVVVDGSDIGPLAPLDSHNDSITWPAAQVVEGNHTAYFCTDIGGVGNDKVGESDESLGSGTLNAFPSEEIISGNCIDRDIFVSVVPVEQPDLVINNLSNPVSPTEGQNITFDAVVENIGDTGAGGDLSLAEYAGNSADSIWSVGNEYFEGISFNDDGTKMYLLDDNDTVYKYNLSNPWDISPASVSYSGNQVDVSSEDSSMLGLYFRSDGEKMYLVGRAGRKIHEYNLSNPWDISPASVSYSGNFAYVGAEDSAPATVAFNPDGTKMFVGSWTGPLREYLLASPWDINNPTYNGMVLDSPLLEGDLNGSITFSANGKKMYLSGFNAGIFEYSLGTPWEPSTASYEGNFLDTDSLPDYSGAGIYEDYGWGHAMKPDGTRIFVLDGENEVWAHQLDLPFTTRLCIDGIDRTACSNGASGIFSVTTQTNPLAAAPGPGNAETASFTWPAPLGSDGPHTAYVCVDVDGDGVVDESDEGLGDGKVDNPVGLPLFAVGNCIARDFTVDPIVLNPAGTLTGSSCTVAEGNSICNTGSLNWTATDVFNGSIMEGGSTIESGIDETNSPGVVGNITLERNSKTFELWSEAGGTGDPLTTYSMSASCAAGLVWDVSDVCIVDTIPDPDIELNINPGIIRAGSKASVSWDTKVLEDMTCTINGPGMTVPYEFNPSTDTDNLDGDGDPTTGILPEDKKPIITSKSIFVLACIHNPSGDVFNDTATVETVGTIEER